jgi:2-dehydro-3-deoxygluconokinase
MLMAEKIITFGEIMLRLSTPNNYTINQTNSFISNYGGGEANVAIALSHMGHKTYFMSKLPPNQLGDGAIGHLRKHGVNTDYIVRGSTTMGIYFLETGFGGRASKVIYNRKHSAITRIQLDEFNLDEVFKDATWFHVSGISLALNDRVKVFAIACAKYCKEHGIPVSFDFNYRAKLWTIEEAIPAYREIIQYVDVTFGSFFDANTLIGIPLDKGLENASMHEKRANVFPKLMEKYGVKYMFGTDRVIYSATENSLAGYVYSKDHFYLSEPINFMIYDRIGGGDAFASGVIHGLLKDFNDPKYAVNFGLATSVLKHTIYGDACTLTAEEIEEFMNQNGTAEVQR